MSWQDDVLIEQETANLLYTMSETEWRELCGENSEW